MQISFVRSNFAKLAKTLPCKKCYKSIDPAAQPQKQNMCHLFICNANPKKIFV